MAQSEVLLDNSKLTVEKLLPPLHMQQSFVLWKDHPNHLNSHPIPRQKHFCILLGCFVCFRTVLHALAQFWVHLHGFWTLLQGFACFWAVFCALAWYCVLLRGFVCFHAVLWGFLRGFARFPVLLYGYASFNLK